VLLLFEVVDKHAKNLFGSHVRVVGQRPRRRGQAVQQAVGGQEFFVPECALNHGTRLPNTDSSGDLRREAREVTEYFIGNHNKRVRQAIAHVVVRARLREYVLPEPAADRFYVRGPLVLRAGKREIFQCDRVVPGVSTVFDAGSARLARPRLVDLWHGHFEERAQRAQHVRKRRFRRRRSIRPGVSLRHDLRQVAAETI